jgi:hypothetical protein
MIRQSAYVSEKGVKAFSIMLHALQTAIYLQTARL